MVAENAGTEMVLRDRATLGVDDYDGEQPGEHQYDLCSICRTDLGEFLGITAGRADDVPLAIEQ